VQHFEDSVVSYATGLTVNTRFTFKRYLEMGYPSDRLLYVPNGVERSRFETPQDLAPYRQRWGLTAGTPLVAYVGTLSIVSHAVDLLLEAFAVVARQLPDSRLLLVGGGEDYDELKALAAQLGIAGQTIFAGRLPPAEIPAVLSLATISTDPVRDNPVAAARSPLKVVESLAVGTPVITGNIGDRQAMLANGALGVLVPPGDCRSLAQGILSLLQAPELRAQMTQASLMQREKWYWDRLACDFAQIYTGSLLARNDR
jgi:glycosyltransferase involved in cell wall biosynthesis